jgi:hypothetical protein
MKGVCEGDGGSVVDGFLSVVGVVLITVAALFVSCLDLSLCVFLRC